MQKTETYEVRKQKAAHLYLDGKCCLSMAVAICFSDSKEALRALTELRQAF